MKAADGAKIGGGTLAGILLTLAVTLAQAWWNAPRPAPSPDPVPVVNPQPAPPAPVPPAPIEPAVIEYVLDDQGLLSGELAEAVKTLARSTSRTYHYVGVGQSGESRTQVAVGEHPAPGPQPSPLPPTPPPVVDPTVKATAAIYVYEKDDGTPPPQVAAELSRLNLEEKILACPFEDDSKNGLGQVPAWARVAAEDARKHGGPLLVIQAGDIVVARVHKPTTADEVRRAVE